MTDVARTPEERLRLVKSYMLDVRQFLWTLDEQSIRRLRVTLPDAVESARLALEQLEFLTRKDETT